MRKFVAACSLALLVATQAFAGDPLTNPASMYVKALGDQALSTIHDASIPKEKKQATIEKLFKENLDFAWVGKFVMGRFWREATDDQKTRYLETYKNFLTKHYTSRFSEYTSGSFKVTDSKEIERGDSQVTMEIVSDEKGAAPVVIDYKIHKVNGAFKVYDIIVEGVSLITTQRSEFGAVLDRSGIEGLISQLAAK